MKRFSLCARAAVLLFCFAATFSAAEIPSPKSVLGFEPGDDRKLADWTQITGYFARLDQASDRIEVRELGKTTQGRPFIVATISAPENLNNIEAIKRAQTLLADPRLLEKQAREGLRPGANASADEIERQIKEAAVAKASGLISNGKAVVVISCSIHSTEIVASQMSMQLAYQLATDDSPDTQTILRNVVLLLIPSLNPDGIDIVTSWYRKTLGTPSEGTSPPELYHPYTGHDNNRDWFMLTQVETQMVTRMFYHEWFPQIVYDVHQQGSAGSRMTVPPFFDPPNPEIPAVLLREVAFAGEHMAADLSAAGFKGIASRTTYDTWWHGGMRTAPYYHNAVGLLTEAASAQIATPIEVKPEQLKRARARGLENALERTSNFNDVWPGGWWHARDILRMEMQTSRSLLLLAARYREEFLRNFHELGRKSVDQGSNSAPYGYILSAGHTGERGLNRLIRILQMQGMDVQPLTGAALIGGERFPAGSYFLTAAHPYRSNLRALLEPQSYPTRVNLRGEVERPYDVAGWTLSMLMGVRAVPLHDPPHLKLGPQLGVAPATPPPNAPSRHSRVGVYKSYSASMDEGWMRWVLEQNGVAYASLRDAEVRGGNLRAAFEVIVLPSQTAREIVSGLPNAADIEQRKQEPQDAAPDQPPIERKPYPEQYAGGIGPEGVRQLRAFVEDGGVLVAIDQAADFAIKEFGLPVRNALDGLKSSEFFCPGSVVRITLAADSPITRGLPRAVDAYFVNSRAFEVFDEQGARSVARYAPKDVLRSGWLLGEKYLAGKTAIADVSLGKGRVVLFGFRPHFRGWTAGTFPLLFQAIQ